MNREIIKYIVNSDNPHWEDLLLIAIASDENAIPKVLLILDEERRHKKELVRDMNALLSVADTIIEEPKLNRDNFIRKRIDDFYETYKGDVGHCMNRPTKPNKVKNVQESDTTEADSSTSDDPKIVL